MSDRSGYKIGIHYSMLVWHKVKRLLYKSKNHTHIDPLGLISFYLVCMMGVWVYFEVYYGKFKEIEFSHFRLHDTDRQMKMNETVIKERKMCTEWRRRVFAWVASDSTVLYGILIKKRDKWVVPPFKMNSLNTTTDDIIIFSRFLVLWSQNRTHHKFRTVQIQFSFQTI